MIFLVDRSGAIFFSEYCAKVVFSTYTLREGFVMHLNQDHLVFFASGCCKCTNIK